MSNKKKDLYRGCGWYEGEYKNDKFHGQGSDSYFKKFSIYLRI